MNILWQYMKSYRKTAAFCLVSTAIFALVFYLSGSDVGAVLYAALLSALVGIGFFVYGFLKFRRRHHILKRLIGTIDSQVDGLPEPHDVLSSDYTKIIRSLHEEKRDFESRAYIARKEMADYFTLWAHQIKTPISAMDLILQSGNGGSRDRALAMELFNIEEYVNMAMSYIRIEDISQDFGFEPLDLDDLIRKTLKKYADIFIRKKISIDFRETGKTIVSDSKWLGLVLEQILSNALKYTEEGGRISIGFCENRLVIQDTGIGIKEEDLPRLFSKSFTGYNGRQHRKSTGQGLYLCKMIMDKLSFGISISSKEGEGTKVYLDFSEQQ